LLVSAQNPSAPLCRILPLMCSGAGGKNLPIVSTLGNAPKFSDAGSRRVFSPLGMFPIRLAATIPLGSCLIRPFSRLLPPLPASAKDGLRLYPIPVIFPPAPQVYFFPCFYSLIVKSTTSSPPSFRIDATIREDSIVGVLSFPALLFKSKIPFAELSQNAQHFPFSFVQAIFSSFPLPCS